MADQIRYDILTQQALRGVVRTVLTDVVKSGLPGEHHFYISFDTQAEGVRLSQRLRAQYPDEMTIILQHQFWDLSVDDDGFEVGLSFGGVPERLVIPFAAVKSFFDPSVQFGLQFEDVTESPDIAQDTKSLGGKFADGKPPEVRQPESRQDAGKDAGKDATRDIGAKPPNAKPQSVKPPNATPQSAKPQESGAQVSPASADKSAPPSPPASAAEPPPSEGAQVVQLDRFRKK